MLKEYDKLYYNGESPITDQEYDVLKEEARKDIPSDPYFNEVGASVPGEKVKLPFVLGSLNKVKTDTLDKWTSGVKGPYVVMEKLDGVSFYIEYFKGKVRRAATRGDGEYGKDITDKAKIFCPEIEFLGKMTCRCEAMLTFDLDKKLGFKNRRNGVSGIINKDGIENVEYITPFFYEIIEYVGCEFTIPENEKIEYLRGLDLKVPNYITSGSLNSDDLISFLDYTKGSQQFSSNPSDHYDIDGLVIVPVDNVREDVMYPKNKVAFKVNDPAVKCKVTGIVWDTSRTGRVVPVVHIEPTIIGGVTVEKTTGFNAEFVFNNKIQVGTEVMLVRSGDVIPYITEVISSGDILYDFPNQCPSCDDKIEWKSVDLICNNPFCGDQAFKKVEHFLTTLGAEYITEKTLRKLGIDEIEKAYEINEFEIAGFDGFGIKRGEQIVNEIGKTLKTTPDKLIAALGIPNVGNTVGKAIVKHYDQYPPNIIMKKFFSEGAEDFEEIDGIGEIIANNIEEERYQYWDLYNTFLNDKGLKFEEGTSELDGAIITVTGKGPMGRNPLKKLIESKGGTVKGISKKTNILVTADLESNSGKMKKAREYGIKIIDYNELMEMLNG